MEKTQSLHNWILTGYSLFAQEGLEGIKVERIAHMMNRNKSGFYHYFIDREIFLEELIEHHQSIAVLIAQDVSKIDKFDPEFIHILLHYREAEMFQMQLVRYRQHDLLRECYTNVNFIVEAALMPCWSKFLGIPDKHELAHKYFELARDMFYSRITSDTMNEKFLKELIYEVRNLIQEIMHQKQGIG